MSWQRTKATTPPIRIRAGSAPKRVDAPEAIATLREAAIACRLTGMKANVKEEDLTALADLIERLSGGDRA